jgi:hypothetical protein
MLTAEFNNWSRNTKKKYNEMLEGVFSYQCRTLITFTVSTKMVMFFGHDVMFGK